MQHSKIFTPFLGFLIIVLGSPKNIKAETTVSTPVIMAGVFGTIAGGFGLYKLYQWYTREETNEELLINGTKALHNHENMHHETIHALTAIFSLYLGPSYTKHDMAPLSDDALNQCALYISGRTSYNTWHLKSDVTYTISDLKNHEQKITNRCTVLLIKNRDAQEQANLTQLQHCVQELHALIENLSCISNLYDFHGNYFEYFNDLKRINNQYYNAIETLHNSWFEHQLPQLCNQHGSKFPLVYFMHDLKRGIDRLYNIKADITIRYKTLFVQVKNSLRDLETLFNVISTTDLYRHQLIAYNAYWPLEQERLRLERERLALQQQQLQAQQTLIHAQHLATVNAWNNWWQPSQPHKNTFIVVPQPAPVVIQSQPHQPSITINNNPVFTQEVKPIIEQKPTIVQSPTITVENNIKKPEKKDEPTTTSSFTPFTYDMSDPELALLNYMN